MSEYLFVVDVSDLSLTMEQHDILSESCEGRRFDYFYMDANWMFAPEGGVSEIIRGFVNSHPDYKKSGDDRFERVLIRFD